MEVKQAAMEEIRAARASTTSGARGHQAEEGKEGGQVDILNLANMDEPFCELFLNKALLVLELWTAWQ